MIGFVPQAMNNHCETVERSPDNKRPVGTVPDAADKERQKKVNAGTRKRTTTAAERYVDVIFQPSRKCHVPAAPKLLNIQCLIGGVEVFRQTDTENQAASDCHVGITAEIEVQLQRVSQNGHPRAEKLQLLYIAPAFIDVR